MVSDSQSRNMQAGVSTAVNVLYLNMHMQNDTCDKLDTSAVR